VARISSITSEAFYTVACRSESGLGSHLVRLLAAIDHHFAECEDLPAQPVLSYDEEEFVAIQLASGLHARKQAERLLRKLDGRD
jgi:hypothetical protein